MFPQGAVRWKRLGAQVAGKGSFARVRPHVNQQHRGAEEALFTRRALVVLGPGWLSEMAAQVDT